MLEFVTFKSLAHCILSLSKRLAQAGGPFEFEFKERDNIMYINIDGEFYHLTNAKRITIQKAEDYISGGRLRILINPKD